jgi:hypothetical protein
MLCLPRNIIIFKKGDCEENRSIPYLKLRRTVLSIFYLTHILFEQVITSLQNMPSIIIYISLIKKALLLHYK